MSERSPATDRSRAQPSRRVQILPMLPENRAENCVISEAPPDIAYFHRSRLFRSFGGNCTSSRRECAESISEIPSFRLKAGRAQRHQAFRRNDGISEIDSAHSRRLLVQFPP